MKKLLVTIVVALLVLAMGTGTVWAAEEKQPPTINVTGSGKISVAPDITQLNFEVITTNPSPVTAQIENNEKMNKVYENLTTLGVAKADIETAAFSISPIWDYNQDKKASELTGYRVTNSIVVKIRKIEQAGKVIIAVTEAGVNSIQGMTFDVNDRAPHRIEALKAAAQDARQQAEVVATALGLKLGTVRSVNVENSYDYPRPMMVSYSDRASLNGVSAPISANNVEVTARIYVTYELVQE